MRPTSDAAATAFILLSAAFIITYNQPPVKIKYVKFSLLELIIDIQKNRHNYAIHDIITNYVDNCIMSTSQRSKLSPPAVNNGDNFVYFS